jgi:hypothetical protein
MVGRGAGRDALPLDPGQDQCGTGVPPVSKNYGRDARATLPPARIKRERIYLHLALPSTGAGLINFFEYASAKKYFAVIQSANLAGSERALRLIEFQHG